MSQTQTLLEELERAVSRGSEQTRLAALTYTTDLLMAGRYNDEETWVFGEVVGLLAAEIETGARAELAERLAVLPSMPSNIVCKFAFDDAIEVAGPVLRQSERLGVSDLVANAKTKSQAHLLAISQRRSLHEDITDVLVSRGDREVVRAVAKNPGAKFSDSGFWRLVQRSDDAGLHFELVTPWGRVQLAVPVMPELPALSLPAKPLSVKLYRPVR